MGPCSLYDMEQSRKAEGTLKSIKGRERRDSVINKRKLLQQIMDDQNVVVVVTLDPHGNNISLIQRIHTNVVQIIIFGGYNYIHHLLCKAT